MSSSQHVYEIRPRKDRRGIDLIGERLPLGVLWFEGPDAIEDAVNYARSFSSSNPAIIRVLDESGTLAAPLRPCLMSSSKSIATSKEQEATIAQQQASIAELKSMVTQQKKDFQATAEGQQKQIDALTAGLQKVSAQLEASKPAPQTVVGISKLATATLMVVQ
jgi:uncharacterized coiled-coil protein SlyX